VISNSRGRITVLDRPRLEALSCECYGVVKTEIDLLLAHMPQRQLMVNSNTIPTVTLPTSNKSEIIALDSRRPT